MFLSERRRLTDAVVQPRAFPAEPTCCLKARFLNGLLHLSVQNTMKEPDKTVELGELLCNKGCAVFYFLFLQVEQAPLEPRRIFCLLMRFFFFFPNHSWGCAFHGVVVQCKELNDARSETWQ